MRKVRLAIDCRAATESMSGVGRYVLNLAKELGKTGEFRFFLLVRKNFHPDLRILPNTELVFLPKEAESIHYTNRLYWEQRFLRHHLRALNLDIFHATWNYGIPLMPPCPSILTLHDLLPIKFPSEFGSRSWRYAYLASQYIALYQARKIIAVSQSTKNEIIKHASFAAPKTTVILEGVEEEFRPASSNSSPRAYLLYVGGYGARKNVGNLLRAYEQAVTLFGISHPLYMTGFLDRFQSEDRAVYDQLILSVRENIKFLGFVRDADLPTLYQCAAMLIFPSLGEGFGFPPLEAMACATPVVTTKCGSIPEVVGEAARFVNGSDPNSIAQGIADVARNATLRSELVERGLTRSKTLSWKNCSDATINVYEEILAERGKQ